MPSTPLPRPHLTRRNFVQNCALGAMALASGSILGCRTGGGSTAASKRGPASRIIPLDRDWLFGGKYHSAAMAPAFDDTSFARVTLPHSVAKLSWQNWETADWQEEWVYRRHLTLPQELSGMRVFLHFDGVMVGATPTVNGHTLPQHLGGYLPARYELTDFLVAGENVLAVAVDSRWSNVPPEGAEVGAKRVDFLEPGGIHRSARLEVVPAVFLSDVFAKPVAVLDDGRRVEVTCTIDSALPFSDVVAVQVELRDGDRVVARARENVSFTSSGEKRIGLTLANLGNIRLWNLESPQLYDVVATLFVGEKPVHDYRTRIGLREARFALDGFFLNGNRVQLFGLNRHELFPYVGFAMPSRVMRRDAEILRRDFHCNIVRCSHYPQSEAFLDACDELGLMVWEEIPGWNYVGDDAWKKLLLRDVHDMVVRDRNHPAIIIWGDRVNESSNEVDLYRQSKAIVRALDDSRPTAGSMTSSSRKTWEQDWHEDVFAFDDYHADADGTVGIEDPTPGVPYLLAEAVGQFNYAARKGFDIKYRRAGDSNVFRQQALRHAQAHSKAATNPRICGVIAWCGFDYASLFNSYNNVKCPGVADTFRIPKLGAAFYLSQGDPKVRAVIAPNFFWDFGPQTPRGPGKGASIFSNCDRLELFVDGRHHATLNPDAKNYPHLKHPPFFSDLEFDGGGHPELRIDGLVAGQVVLSRSFSSDPSEDRLLAVADDPALTGNGIDATRLEFKVVDKFNAERAYADGQVAFEISGPGEIVGDNPFALAATGGVGAVWIRAKQDSAGRITVTLRHSRLGEKNISIDVKRALTD